MGFRGKLIMRKLLREPLVHFLGAGILIFLFAIIWQNYSPSRDTIVVTQQDLLRMASVYSSEAGTTPSVNDLQGMINDYVETVALASEARRLGLDNGDVVVERRLAQKMRFMIDDLSDIPNISESKLRDWFEDNRTKFERPTLYSFEHVYFRNDNDERISESLKAIQNGDDWQGRGDAFMLQRQYGDLPKTEIVRLFGKEFANGIETATPNVWVGPQESTLGTHIFRVNRVILSSTPEFEEISDQIRNRWRDEQFRKLNQDAIAKIVQSYNVHIESIQ